MIVDKEKLNREAIDMAAENAVLRYKTYTMAPAIQKLLGQCACIEAKLTREESNALSMFKDLQQDIIELLQVQNQENNEC